MRDLLDKLLQITESIIDFARDDLDPAIWTKDRLGRYSL